MVSRGKLKKKFFFKNFYWSIVDLRGFLRGTLAKAGDVRDAGSIPELGRFPWRRAWQHTPVFLPGESPWTEEPGRLWSIGSQRVGHD